MDLLVSIVEKLFIRLHTLVRLQIHFSPLSIDYVMVAGGAADKLTREVAVVLVVFLRTFLD